MQSQLFTIPFENLDVQAGKIVSLIPEDIVHKIVQQHRGGYCYEVNGLFSMVLQALGIPHIFAAARPMFYPAKRPKTHMVLIATIERQQYLLDLGFGSYGLRAPLALADLGQPVVQGDDKYLLTRVNTTEYLLQAWTDGAWANQFSFEIHHQEWIDFAPANYLNSTHPESVFVQKPLVVLHHTGGRKVLFGNTLKHIQKGISTVISFETKDYDALLKTEFGLMRPM